MSTKVFSLSVRSLRSMWWSRLACVLVARDDSTLLTRTLKWILRTTLASPSQSCLRLHSTVAQWIHLPAHTAHATQNWLQTNCPDFIAKDQWPPNSPDLNPLDYHVWGQCWRPITSAIRNRKRSPNWGSPAGDLGQPTSATNRQSCQRVLKATIGLCCSWRWTFRTFTVTAMSWLCYFCLNDVILLRDYLDIFERAKIARWQHCNADNFRTL